MNRPNWVLGTLVTLVLTIVGVLQTGMLKSCFGSENNSISSQKVTSEALFDTEAGWRYQRGLPNHWKYLVMHETP